MSEPRRAALRGAAVAVVVATLSIVGLTVFGQSASRSGTPNTGTTTTGTTMITVASPTAVATVAPLTTVAATVTTVTAPTTTVIAPTTTVTATTTTVIAPTTTVTATTTTATPSSAPVAVTVVSDQTSSTGDPPAVDAASYVVYEPSTQRWLAELGADTTRPVGSVIKLLTAYVVMQAGDPERIVTVPNLQVDPSESAIGLYAGEQLSRAVLLRAMLIVSANDAARTLALDVGGTTDAFVGQMNAAAASLGLGGTVAANPIGLDATGAHSTARDMATLAALLMQDATFRATVARTSATLHGTTFASTNDLLLRYPGADGVKTGHTTRAGYCLVGSATRDGRQVIVVVLGSSSNDARVAAESALFDWAFAQP